MKTTQTLSTVLIAIVIFGQSSAEAREYYVDSGGGNDQNSGTSESSPWKTLEKVSSTTFEPADRIYFRRGRSYSGCAVIKGDGTADHPITIGAYGAGKSPCFTNPDKRDHSGNAMQIRGDYQIVENLYFHHAASAPSDASFEEVWSAGALHVSLGSDYVVIRNNEFSQNAKAIQSYSEHSLITKNYIHGRNDREQGGFLSLPNWGPVGIHLGIGNQEVSYNTIEKMYAEGGEWGGDGGAIEIDDGRNHKENIHIHHNQTKHNMGFLEISWDHDIQKRRPRNIIIEHNINRDYQSFVFWWAKNAASSQNRIRNNTILRTDSVSGMALDTVFTLDSRHIEITKNIIVVPDGMQNSVFTGDSASASLRSDNCYWDIDDGTVDLGIEAGRGEFTADPLFVDFDAGDYRLHPESPARGLGAYGDGNCIVARDKPAHFEKLMDYGISRDAVLAPAAKNNQWVKLEDSDPHLGNRGGDRFYAAGNSGGTTRTLYEKGNSLTLIFKGSQVRFYGLKSDDMVSANILIDGVVVAENVSCRGDREYQALLWESDVLTEGVHTAEIISNGDTVEVDFVEYR